MSYSITYTKEKGNTELLARTVLEVLNKEDVTYFGDVSEEAKKNDTIFVGFWTDKGVCDQKNIDFLKTLHGKKIFLFGSCGFGLSQEYFDEILKRSKAFISDDNEIIGTFICVGKMKMAVRERYGKLFNIPGADTAKIQTMIDNFDEALKHPDELDLNRLKASVLSSITK